MALIFTLFLIGFALLAIEILVAPGAIIGILGVISCAVAIYLSFLNHGSAVGFTVLIAFIAICTFGIWLAFKLDVFKRMSVRTNLDGKVNSLEEFNLEVGMKGVALGSIRPSGKGKFDAHIVEVTSLGNLIDAGASIEIINIENNKIYVKTIES